MRSLQRESSMSDNMSWSEHKDKTLGILNELNNKLDSMTDEELYEHMMKTSPSFRETMRKFNEFLEEKEKEEAN